MRASMAGLVALAFCIGPRPVAAEPLRICATTTDLGSLARTVGGDEVDVTVFAKGTEDPHFVEAKPSFVKALSRAQLLVLVGLDLEAGWLPPLLQAARNAQVLPRGRGHLDASRVIEPLEVSRGTVDRAAGDVHPAGNPHYLLDPVNGLRVADAIRAALETLRPGARQGFTDRYETFRARLGAAMLGERLGGKYPLEKIAELYALGKLDGFLEAQHERDLLGGWFAAMRKARGVAVVADHNVWPYFARRFGLRVIGFLEPVPGYPPTTRHLQALLDEMRARDVRLVLSAAYYDPRHARFVTGRSTAIMVEMANQAGARPGTDDYLAMIDHNVRAVAGALAGERRP